MDAPPAYYPPQDQKQPLMQPASGFSTIPNQPEQGDSQLITAVRNNDMEGAKNILEPMKSFGELGNQHRNVNYRNSVGNTALLVAVKNQNVPMAETILDMTIWKKDAINTRNNAGETAMMAAAGNQNMVQLLNRESLDEFCLPKTSARKKYVLILMFFAAIAFIIWLIVVILQNVFRASQQQSYYNSLGNDFNG